MGCPTCSSRTILEALSYIATKVMVLFTTSRKRHISKASVPAWAAAGPTSTTMGTWTSTFRACGKLQASAYQGSPNFIAMHRPVFVSNTNGTPEEMRSIGTWAMASSRTSGMQPRWKWGDGRGLLTFGTGITTATATFTSQMDTSPGPDETNSLASSGDKSSPSHLRIQAHWLLTNADGTR